MPKDPALNAAVGRRIAEFRAARGLTRKQFSERLKTYEINVQRWEEGRTVPHAVFLIAIAHELGTTVDELMAAHPDALPTGTGGE